MGAAQFQNKKKTNKKNQQVRTCDKFVQFNEEKGKEKEKPGGSFSSKANSFHFLYEMGAPNMTGCKKVP